MDEEKLIPMSNEKSQNKVLRITIDIREELIQHWGGLVINNFARSADQPEEILPYNVTVPGFVYDIDENKNTFSIKTERYSPDEKKKASAKQPKRAARNRKVSHKKPK